MTRSASTLVAIATYNEIDNLPRLVDEIFRHVDEVDILVIDDNSPDGTGRWCDERARQDERLRCLHRPGKLGLGSATLAGLRYALDHGYRQVLTMDADFSHPPRYLPEMLKTSNRTESPPDVVIGSRYVTGGGIDGWPLHRRIMSRLVNWYARLLLRLPVRDCSGALRCYQTDVLRRLDLDAFRSQGYAYLEEMLWRLRQVGATFEETPIRFIDRQHGQTKINMQEAFSTLWIILRLGLSRHG